MNMRLLCIFAAILALSSAEEAKNEHLEDLVAEETVELMKENHDLYAAASAYNAYVPSQTPWNPPQNYVPQNTYAPQQDPIQPVNYIPPSPPQNEYVPVPNNYPYRPPHNTWKPTPPTPPTPPHHHHHYPTTTPTTVIKNEQNWGNNGDYNYVYQLSDGTSVGENGYFTSPKHEENSIVKQGWYSFPDSNGKIYTVKWWADYTGFHAYGDHLPSAPAYKVAHDVSAKTGDEKPLSYPINENPTQNVHTDHTFPPYPQPVEYQPHQTYSTYQ